MHYPLYPQLIKSLLLKYCTFSIHQSIETKKTSLTTESSCTTTLSAPHQSSVLTIHPSHLGIHQCFSQSWPPLSCTFHTIFRNSAETSGVNMQISALAHLPPSSLVFRHRSLHQLLSNPCLHPRNSFAWLVEWASPADF